MEPKKVRVIENYSILHNDALLQRKNRECNNIVLFLGEIGKRKGCYDIPKVVSLVKEQIPSVQFVLAGSGKEELTIKNLFNSNVVFPGWVRGAEKDNYLRNADVFFLPSYNEGMPMSVLDAMGYGLPIVSTNVGGIPKIVSQNGFCCTPGDVDAMAHSILTLLSDDKKRLAAADASYEIVKNHYSLDSHIKRLEEAYEEVLNR